MTNEDRFMTLKGQLRREGASVLCVNQCARDEKSRYEEITVVRPGRPPKRAIVTIYADGGYELFLLTPHLKISADAAELLID
jgi:hypothetical protein